MALSAGLLLSGCSSGSVASAGSAPTATTDGAAPARAPVQRDTLPPASPLPLDTMLGFRLGQSEEEALSSSRARGATLDCREVSDPNGNYVKMCSPANVEDDDPRHYTVGVEEGVLTLVSRNVEPDWSGVPIDSLMAARTRARGTPEHALVQHGGFSARWYGRGHTAVLDLMCRDARVARGCSESIETTSPMDAAGHWGAHQTMPP